MALTYKVVTGDVGASDVLEITFYQSDSKPRQRVKMEVLRAPEELPLMGCALSERYTIMDASIKELAWRGDGSAGTIYLNKEGKHGGRQAVTNTGSK